MDIFQITAIIASVLAVFAVILATATRFSVSGLKHEIFALRFSAKPSALRNQDEYAKPPKTIEQLAAQQGVKPFDFAEARRAANFWPEDESADDFIAWLRASRKEGATERELD